MVRSHQDLRGLYTLEKTIGCGGFAKVKLATHAATGEKVAVKIMNKTSLGDDLPRVETELKALKSVSHQHVCKLYQVVSTDSHYFLVMEYCSGGELFDHIVEKSRLSEAESRMFFRQIVSGVAYLHSLGYAHRDLKPENILLDKDQNLKLIDFGLCARPEGGMNNPLFTSCGSPTYAAPELVLGREYLGQEVDVWAMGVLLYVLLVGSLPFEDMNMDNLYKKILTGKYEEPRFLSSDSRKLIRQMLQIDPKKRITVKDLLTHPWVTLGVVLDPVTHLSSASHLNFKTFDRDCVNALAFYLEVTPELLWKYLKKWKFDYITSTYFLLKAQKQRVSPLKLHDLPADVMLGLRSEVGYFMEKHDYSSPRTDKRACKENEVDFATPHHRLLRRRIKSPNTTPTRKQEVLAQPKARKRGRSPGPSGESPVPAKKATTAGTPQSQRTPVNSTTSTPKSFLNRVRNVLTPRRTPVKISNAPPQPAVLSNKNLCNVSTTQCNDPEYVITELAGALERKGFHCDRKGFLLLGKVEANVLHLCNGCSFELEICYLPRMGPNNNTPACKNKSPDFDFVGIKRRRLKGDSWCYKKVCEEVLACATKDLRLAKVTESSV